MEDVINPICPNCGEALGKLSDKHYFDCPTCGRELEMLSPKKVVIAEPLLDFSVQDQPERTRPSLSHVTQIINWESTLSPQRRKRSAELADVRVAQERLSNFKARGFGIWSIVLGIFSLGMGWLRYIYLQDDWLAVAIGVFGIISLCGGIFMSIRAHFAIQTLTKSENGLEEHHLP